MSMCKTCMKDVSKHNKKTWLEHNWCPLCQKSGQEHSDELWQMHQRAVVKGAKGDKIRPITVGFARSSVGWVKEWNMPVSTSGQVSPYKFEIIPIYMHCKECKLAMSDAEEDLADVFDGTCIKCFCEMTDQEHHCTTSKLNQEVRT